VTDELAGGRCLLCMLLCLMSTSSYNVAAGDPGPKLASAALARAPEPFSVQSPGAARWLRARRLVDSVIVLVTTPIAVPLAAATMAAVVLSDRAKPLIRLDRVGQHGRSLRLVKIRTMRPVDTGTNGPAITASVDHRVTPVGSVLRRVRLDELPQVASVLTGKLALIGPRPEVEAFVDTNDPAWRKVLSIRPGIAGLTQVIASPWEATQLHGPDPEIRYREIAVPAKVAIDAWYVDHASLRLDLTICWSLVSMMAFGKTWTAAHQLVDAKVPAAAALLEPSRPTTPRAVK